MELHLQVTGMCLFVPQEVSGRLLYHILLPDSSHHPAHRHDAVLTYSGALQAFDLGCHFLDLSGVKAKPGTANLDTVVDVGLLVDDKVPAKQVGKKPEKEVYARVTVPSPTRTQPGDLARWEPHKANGTPRPEIQSTHHMTWIYEDLDPDSLHLALVRLDNGCTGKPTPVLDQPTPAGNTYCINVLHLPPPGTVVQPGGFAPHFRMYGDVFPQKKAPGMKLIDQPAGNPSPFYCQNAPRARVPFDSEAAYNCMLAQSGIK